MSTSYRTRNNLASKRSYEKATEAEHAEEFEYEMVRKHSEIPNTEVRHWSVVPEEWLDDAGYITDYNRIRLERLMRKRGEIEGSNRLKDYGLDGVAKTTAEDGTVVYSGLQAKYYLTRRLCATDIGSFLAVQMFLTAYNNRSKGFLYSTAKLQVDLAGFIGNPINPVQYVHSSWRHPKGRSANGDGFGSGIGVGVGAITEKLLPLRPYQQEIITQLKKHNGINALNIPCRMGKTLIACHDILQKKPKTIVAIAPLRVSVDNLHERLCGFFPSNQSIIVDSDAEGTTNRDEIANFLQFDSRGICKIIFSTYDSAENILNELMTEKDFENAYVIGDEIHNADEKICEFISKFPNGIILSATLPEEIHDMINITHVAKVSFAEGIAGGYIVDYNLWLPYIIERKNGTTGVDVEIPVEFAEYDQDLTAKALYLASVMLKTGSRRCIVYLSNIEECNVFMEVVKGVFELYHGLNIWVDKIDSTVPKNLRKILLTQFQEGDDDMFHILASVRILDEAVDIPRCDSVFITCVGEKSSDIRMMQRSQRSATIDGKNPSKKNNIILWTDEWNKCVHSLSLLKEADPEFHRKIRIGDVRYDIQRNEERKVSIEVSLENLVRWSEISCISYMEKFMQKIDEIKGFREKYGGDYPKQGSKKERNNEKTLGHWIHNLNKKYNKNELSTKIIDMINRELHEFPWPKRTKDDNLTINEVIKQIKAFREKYGGDNPKQGTSRRDNEKMLGRWIGRLNRKYNKNELSTEIIDKINRELPEFPWPKKKKEKENLTLDEAVRQIKIFQVKYGGDYPKTRGKKDNETSLRRWIANLNVKYNKNELSTEIIDKINRELPEFPWPKKKREKENLTLDEAIRQIKTFKEKYGGGYPNKRGKREDEKMLGYWINNLNTKYNKSKLSTEIIDKINRELPTFPWPKKKNN